MLASPIAAASSTSTRRAARCCHCLNVGGSPEANSTSSWTRAATSPGILCPTCTPNSLFQGKTSAVEPTNPYPSLLTTSHSESHWTTTTTTLTAFLTRLDTTVVNPDGSRTPWICFMDVCTVHVSQEFVALHVETHAHIRLVCVPPNTTAVCQPLDRAYMRPFKAALDRSSARYVGREIQHHPDDVASITHSIAGMRSLIMRSQHSGLVGHRLRRCRASRRPCSSHSAPHRRHALQASPQPSRARGPRRCRRG